MATNMAPGRDCQEHDDGTACGSRAYDPRMERDRITIRAGARSRPGACWRGCLDQVERFGCCHGTAIALEHRQGIVVARLALGGAGIGDAGRGHDTEIDGDNIALEARARAETGLTPSDARFVPIAAMRDLSILSSASQFSCSLALAKAE